MHPEAKRNNRPLPVFNCQVEQPCLRLNDPDSVVQIFNSGGWLK